MSIMKFEKTTMEDFNYDHNLNGNSSNNIAEFKEYLEEAMEGLSYFIYVSDNRKDTRYQYNAFIEINKELEIERELDLICIDNKFYITI